MLAGKHTIPQPKASSARTPPGFDYKASEPIDKGFFVDPQFVIIEENLSMMVSHNWNLAMTPEYEKVTEAMILAESVIEERLRRKPEPIMLPHVKRTRDPPPPARAWTALLDPLDRSILLQVPIPTIYRRESTDRPWGDSTTIWVVMPWKAIAKHPGVPPASVDLSREDENAYSQHDIATPDPGSKSFDTPGEKDDDDDDIPDRQDEHDADDPDEDPRAAMMKLVHNAIVDRSNGYLELASFRHLLEWNAIVDRICARFHLSIENTSASDFVIFSHDKFNFGLFITDKDNDEQYIMLDDLFKPVSDGGLVIKSGIDKWILGPKRKRAYLDADLNLIEENPDCESIITPSPRCDLTNKLNASVDQSDFILMMMKQMKDQADASAIQQQTFLSLIKEMQPSKSAEKASDGADASKSQSMPHHKHAELLREGLIKLKGDWSNLDDWKTRWQQWHLAMIESNPAQLDMQRRCINLFSEYIDQDLLVNRLIPQLGGNAKYYAMKWSFAMERIVEIARGTIITRLTIMMSELSTIGNAPPGDVATNIAEIDKYRHRLVGLLEEFVDRVDDEKERSEEREFRARHAIDANATIADVLRAHQTLLDESIATVQRISRDEHAYRQQARIWNSLIWGAMTLSRCDQQMMDSKLELLEQKGIDDPASRKTALDIEKIRIMLNASDSVQAHTRRSHQLRRAITPGQSGPTSCKACDGRNHVLGAPMKDFKNPDRTTTCLGPDWNWDAPDVDAATKKRLLDRRSRSTSGKRDRSAPRSSSRNRDRDRGRSGSRSSRKDQPRTDRSSSRTRGGPAVKLSRTLLSSDEKFKIMPKMFARDLTSSAKSRMLTTNCNQWEADRGRSRERRFEQNPECTRSQSIYGKQESENLRDPEYRDEHAVQMTMIDETIAVPDSVAKAFDDLLIEQASAHRPDLPMYARRTVEIARAAIAAPAKALRFGLKTIGVLIDGGATNHNTPYPDRVRNRRGDRVSVGTASRGKSIPAELVDFLRSQPAKCYDHKGVACDPPTLRAQRALFSPDFPEEIWSTNRLNEAGHAIVHPAKPDQSYILWNTSDGRNRWSPLPYRDGYYLDLVVLDEKAGDQPETDHPERICKTTGISESDKQLILHRRFAHMIPIANDACAACTISQRNKAHAKGGCEDRIEKATPGAIWCYDASSIPESIAGNRYMHVFRDVCRDSRLIFVAFSAKKSQDASAIAYKELLEYFPILGEKMRTIVSDSDLAFTGERAESTMRQCFPSAKHCPNPPHDQGEHGLQESTISVAKRAAQTMIHDSGLPIGFFEYAVRYAIHVKNLLQADEKREVWPDFQRTSIHNLRPFGCSVHYHDDLQSEFRRGRSASEETIGSNRGSTKTRQQLGRSGIFLGFSFRSKSEKTIGSDLRTVIILDKEEYERSGKKTAIKNRSINTVLFSELSDSKNDDVRDRTPITEGGKAEMRDLAKKHIPAKQLAKLPNLQKYLEVDTDIEIDTDEDDEFEIVTTDAEISTGDSTPAFSRSRKPSKKKEGRSATPARRMKRSGSRGRSPKAQLKRLHRDRSIGSGPAEQRLTRHQIRKRASEAIGEGTDPRATIFKMRQLIAILAYFLTMLLAMRYESASRFAISRLDSIAQESRQQIITDELRRFGIIDPTGLTGKSQATIELDIPHRRRRQRRFSGPDAIAIRNQHKLRKAVQSGRQCVDLAGDDHDPLIDPNIHHYVAAAKAAHPKISMQTISSDEEWNPAIQREQEVIARSGQWIDFKDLPIGTTTLRAQYVLKIKRCGRRKARIVACGNQQSRSPGERNYSPATSGAIVRLMIAIGQLMPGSTIGTIDCDEAFLQSELKQLIAVHLPKEWRHDLNPITINGKVYDPANPHAIPMLLLRKSIYGLRAAPREWLSHFDSGLKIAGAIKSGTDSCTYAIFDNDGAHIEKPDQKERSDPPRNGTSCRKAGGVRFTEKRSKKRSLHLDELVRTDPPIAIITIYVDDVMIVASSAAAFDRTVLIIQSIVKTKSPDILLPSTADRPSSAVDFLGINHVRSASGDITATIEECRSKLCQFRAEAKSKSPCTARVIPETANNSAISGGAANAFKPCDGQPSWRTAVGIIQYLADAAMPQLKYCAWQIGKVSADPRESNRKPFESAIGYTQQFSPKLIFPKLHDDVPPCDEEIRIAEQATRLWYRYTGRDASGSRYSKLDWNSTYPKRPRPIQLRAFSDSDWAGEPNGASTSGYLITIDQDASIMPRIAYDKQQRTLYAKPILETVDPFQLPANRGMLISWSSKRQSGLPALSSAEAELHAIVATAKQSIYLIQALIEFRCFHRRDVLPAIIHGDNSSANTLAMRSNISRTRHSSLRASWSRSLFESQLAFIAKIPTKMNPADLLTKPSSSKFNERWEAVNIGISKFGDEPVEDKRISPAIARISNWMREEITDPPAKPRLGRSEKRERRLGMIAV